MGREGRDDAETLMALNLIKVSTKTGPVYVGVAWIATVIPAPDGCVIKTVGGEIEVLDQASYVAELANRRPPDGN